MITKVKLRTKAISGNRQAYYLDFYPPVPHPETGEPTRREFLGLFLHNEIEHEEQPYIDKNGKPKTRIVSLLSKNGEPKKVRLNPLQKQNNQQTGIMAEQLRQRRDNELNKPEVYTGFEKEQLRIKEQGAKSFIDYFKQLGEKRKGSNRENWMATFNFLSSFTNNKLKFSELNVKLCNDFKEYLLTSPSTWGSYFIGV